MAGDSAEDWPHSTTEPEATATWIEERASALGLSRDEFLRRLVAAYRAVAEEEAAPASADDLEAVEAAVETAEGSVEAVEGDVDAVEEDVDELRTDLAKLDGAVDEKIQDVRRRVIQVKREADEKADADHDHPDLREDAAEAAARVTDVERDLAALADDIDDLDDRLADARERLDAGFENYEEILEYLTETTDDVTAKLDTLARATLEMRTAVKTLAGRAEKEAAVDELKSQANQQGVRSATCEECGESVDVALLTRPECPACAGTFSGVEPKQGLFGSPTLAVGDLPALEPGDRPGIDVESLLEDDTDLDPIIDE